LIFYNSRRFNMESVQIKGVKNGIKAVLAASIEFDALQAAVKQKLEKSKELFSSREDLCVSFECNSMLTHVQKCQLQKVVFKVFGDNVLVSFESPVDEVVSRLDMTERCIFYRGTLRSGTNMHSEGHLFVYGDVNPGAEVSASGNVIVLGILKGIVHAGIGGDRDAFVMALGLAPTQIRIADIITRSPDGESPLSERPEIAYIKDDRIYIDTLIKRR